MFEHTTSLSGDVVTCVAKFWSSSCADGSAGLHIWAVRSCTGPTVDVFCRPAAIW
ncbi:MAG: hypothetical protein L3J88_05135 [Gammaproteobacteria bacterium]|nr:hypothetical protein [Gammaproteobacteria bacterium]